MSEVLRTVAGLLDQGRHDEAGARLSAWLRQLPRPWPGDLPGLAHIGPLALRCGLPDEARHAFEAQLAAGAPGPDLLVNLGVALRRCGEPELALQRHEQALRLDPRHAAAHNNRSLVLAQLARPEEALEALEQALQGGLDGRPQRLRQALLLQALGRHERALEALQRGLAAQPDDADWLAAAATSLHALGQAEPALQHLERALERQPRTADLHGRRGRLLAAMGRLAPARDAYAAAVAADSGSGPWLSALVQARQALADWSGWPGEVAQLQAQARAGQPLASVFPLLVTSDEPRLQLDAMRAWAAAQPALPVPPLQPLPADPQGRVRLGWFSADLHDHPVGHLLAPLLERLDRTRFRCCAFMLGARRDDAWQRRIAAAVDQVVELGALSDAQAVARARDWAPDVAIDLHGATEGMRPGLFAARVAPLQLGWLGWLGTTGASWIDYLVADRLLVPAGREADFSEKLLRLPAYQPNDPWRPPDPGRDGRADWGLPERAFVLASFNSPYKITPPIFDAWMQVLRACPPAVLWLHVDRHASPAALAAAAGERGVDPSRIVFAPACPLAQHLQRQRHADLHLDTWPYNGGVTTSNALRAGLPVLTLAGRSPASRMGASLLHAVGLPELVCPTLQAYQTAAIELARQPGRIEALRSRLWAQLPGAPLFDPDRLARSLEAGLQAIVDRQRRKLPAAHLEVRPEQA